MIEIPPKFSGISPVGPIPTDDKQVSFKADWHGATGLAEDVRRYGAWMRAEGSKRIGQLYPTIEITNEMTQVRPDLKSFVGQKLTVIAWIWARTVKSPNPAFSHVDVPLISTFILSSKAGKEAYVEPIVEGDHYRFTVKVGKPPEQALVGTKIGRGGHFRCLLSDSPIPVTYIRKQGIDETLGQRMMAIVAEGKNGRVYLAPEQFSEQATKDAKPSWVPDLEINHNPRDIRTQLYGLTRYKQLFTPRQLVALTTFNDLVAEARDKIRHDALAARMNDDGIGIDSGGSGAEAYAEAISVYLAFAVDKASNYWSSLCSWHSGRDTVTSTFGRQALPMVWDFTEANPFSESTGNFLAGVDQACRCIKNLPSNCVGTAIQADAQNQKVSQQKVISTDPPYYDNICYADLSDYFYLWLRRALRPVYPNLLATIAVPKAEELVATTYRHGSKDKAEAFFMCGMTQAMQSLAVQSHPEGPITIYYAFKQSDTESVSGTSSTGWETFLGAVHKAGLQLTGTWPMRTEYVGNLKKKVNALASSIILVCRKRHKDAPTISRREFLRELNAVLPEALDEMTKGSGYDVSPVAPVDLSQAIIGPGMAIFSKYASVLEADGSPMSVRTALQLINRFLAEDDFDADTQFCLHWFEQYGWNTGPFGNADTLSRAKGTSVTGVANAGVIESGGGNVRLFKWSVYPTDWDPTADDRNPIWETLHHLIRSLKQDGEAKAGKLLAEVKNQSESVRQLAYRLYTLCERQGWAEDARAYNELITSWSGIESAAGAVVGKPTQGDLF